MDALKSRNTNRMVIIIQGQRLNNKKDFNISPPPPPKKKKKKPSKARSYDPQNMGAWKKIINL